MKQLQQHIRESLSPHEIVAPMQRESRHEQIGSFKPYPGQKVWQLERSTGIITEAEYDESSLHLNQTILNGISAIIHNKIIIKPGYLYCVAINKKNAFKQFVKQQKHFL